MVRYESLNSGQVLHAISEYSGDRNSHHEIYIEEEPDPFAVLEQTISFTAEAVRLSLNAVTKD